MKRLFLALSLLGIAACQTTTESGVGKPPDLQAVDPVVGAQFLKEICLDTRPDFVGAPAAIAKYPMTKREKTGAYLHDTLSISAKLWGSPPNECSVAMGIGSNSSKDVRDALRASVPDIDTAIWDIRSVETTNGLLYQFIVRAE